MPQTSECRSPAGHLRNAPDRRLGACDVRARRVPGGAPITSLCVCGVPGWGTACGLAPFLCGAVVAQPASEGRGGWAAAALSGPDGMETRVFLSSRAGACRGCVLPDVGDPVVCDVERERRHDDAVLLGRQTGLAVDHAPQDRQAGCPAGNIGQVARDPLTAWRSQSDVGMCSCGATPRPLLWLESAGHPITV